MVVWIVQNFDRQRITLVASFDEASNRAIAAVLAPDAGQLCKVPYNITDRVANDTLPYHITLSAWDADYAQNIITKLPTLATAPIKVNYRFALMESTIKGNILFLEPVADQEIKALQKAAYDLLPTPKYDPATYRLHATINIAADRAVNLALVRQLQDVVLPLTIDKVCLFAIYPAKLLAEVPLIGGPNV